jgi:hypothetical protein
LVLNRRKEILTLSIIVYNPTNGPSVKSKSIAKRNKPLENSVLGLIDNGKKNSNVVIERAVLGLKRKYKLKDVYIHNKKSFSHGLNHYEAKLLAEKCDFIITGVGD